MPSMVSILVRNIEMDLNEKKEQIVSSYRKTFDKEMAYLKSGISEEEIKALEEDKEFQARLDIFLIDERERIIQNLRTFMDSEDEKKSSLESSIKAIVERPKTF